MKRREFMRFVSRGMVAAGYVGAFGVPSAYADSIQVYETDFGMIAPQYVPPIEWTEEILARQEAQLIRRIEELKSDLRARGAMV